MEPLRCRCIEGQSSLYTGSDKTRHPPDRNLEDELPVARYARAECDLGTWRSGRGEAACGDLYSHVPRLLRAGVRSHNQVCYRSSDTRLGFLRRGTVPCYPHANGDAISVLQLPSLEREERFQLLAAARLRILCVGRPKDLSLVDAWRNILMSDLSSSSSVKPRTGRLTVHALYIPTWAMRYWRGGQVSVRRRVRCVKGGKSAGSASSPTRGSRVRWSWVSPTTVSRSAARLE